MYPAIGNKWTMSYQLGSITWNPPRALDSSCSDSVQKGLAYEIGQLDASKAPIPGDFYYWGGTLAAKARLALIASVFPSHTWLLPIWYANKLPAIMWDALIS